MQMLEDCLFLLKARSEESIIIAYLIGSSLSEPSQGVPSILIMGPVRSGRVTAIQVARVPPKLNPTITGRFNYCSTIYRMISSRCCCKRWSSAPEGGCPANPAKVMT